MSQPAPPQESRPSARSAKRTSTTSTRRTSPTNSLRALYANIKECDQHLRFSFLTGVSKLSKVSLFSSLNNLNDLTLDPRYSSICSYTYQPVAKVQTTPVG